jgi:CheY-like chemotaxis protein
VLATYQSAFDMTVLKDLEALIRDNRIVPAHLILINAATLEELDGLVEQVRQEVPDTPVIGSIFPRQALPELASGVTKALVKPITRRDLETAISEMQQPVKRLLLVDNDLEIIQLYTRMLESSDLGFEVTAVSSGMEALVAMHNQPVDLVLLDLSMPEMDGMAVLDAKNSDPAICDIPVMLISAMDLRTHPLQSRLVVATLADGLGPAKLIECAIGLSDILLKPGMILDRVSE